MHTYMHTNICNSNVVIINVYKSCGRSCAIVSKILYANSIENYKKIVLTPI